MDQTARMEQRIAEFADTILDEYRRLLTGQGLADDLVENLALQLRRQTMSAVSQLNRDLDRLRRR